MRTARHFNRSRTAGAGRGQRRQPRRARRRGGHRRSAAQLFRIPAAGGSAPPRRPVRGSRSPVVVDGLLGYRLPDGSPLDDVEVATQMLCIFIGGTETVPKIVAHGLWELGQRPDQMAAVRADPEHNVPIAREEMIRFCAPAQWFARTARKPFTIHGETIRPGPAGHHPARLGQPRRTGVPRTRRIHLGQAHPSLAGLRPRPTLLHRLPPGQAGSRCAAAGMAAQGARVRDPEPTPPRGCPPASNGDGTTSRWRSDVWSYRIIAPYLFERTSIAEKTPECLADGQVLLRFMAAGVCGSDLPAFRGATRPPSGRRRNQRRRKGRLPHP